MTSRLDTEVWALDKCCGCGDCIALCSKGVLYPGPDQHTDRETREKVLGLSHTVLDTCTFCQKFCEEGCPRLRDEWVPIAPQRVVTASARGVVNSDEPADVLRHLLIGAMAVGLIDGAIVPDMDPWKLRPVAKVATTVSEIVDSAAVHCLWVPTLSALNEAIFVQGLRDLAVVGTPCASQGLRALKGSCNERLSRYQEAVRLSIANFCTGVYLPEMVARSLEEELGVPPRTIRRLEASPRADRLTAVLWNGSTLSIPLAKVEKYTRRGCARCDDYVGESADIAVGIVGATEGACTVIVRSAIGDACLHAAVELGLLELSDEVDQAALARASEEKDRRQRAQQFDRLTVMLLDALAEPRKRAAVRQAYVHLYENKRAAELRKAKEEANCVTCSQC
jgi:coenzyme F420 hydrogenase subunit beta